MKYLLLFLIFALTGCTPTIPEQMVGRWKIEKAWATKPEEVFPGSDLANFMAEKGVQMFMDGERTGHITPQGDTINSFPYEFRNDSLIIHTKGRDLPYRIQFNTPDTLIVADKDGVVIKYSKTKAARK